jgi:rhodanese-related sulfurtransferase
MSRPRLTPVLEALILILFAVLLAAVANTVRTDGLAWSASPAPARPGGELGAAEAQALLRSGQAQFLDARESADFAAGHIPGARSVPPEMFGDEMDKLLSDGPKSRLLVVYCSSLTCPLAGNLAENLKLSGYTQVRVFAGGWQEGTAAGGAKEGGKP